VCVLFYAAGVDNVGVVDLESGEYHFLVAGFGATSAASGHLLWVDPGGTMMSAPFDEERLELIGTGASRVEGVAYGTWGGWNVAASDGGTLLYPLDTSGQPSRPLVRIDRDGETSSLEPLWVADFRTGLALSPDGSRIAATILEGEESHIWVRSSDAGPPVRVTFEGWNGRPRWTPDGERLLHGRVSQGDRGGVVLEDIDATYDISSDGRWLAYLTITSGGPQIEVRPFPEVDDGRWPLAYGAVSPVWEPQPLFPLPPEAGDAFAVAPDGTV